MKKYRVAVIGCLGRGTAAARAYDAHPRTELVALCDLEPTRFDKLGDELNVRVRYTDFNQMLREEDIDIVAIPTATELHYSLVSAVLEYGVHIDVEKPLCTDLVQADTLIDKANAKGVQIAVHHQGRSGAAMKAVRKAVEEGKIGQLRFVQSSGKGYYAGYGLMNIGTHAINAALGIAGHVHKISASATVDQRSVEVNDVLIAANGMGCVVGEDITAALEYDNGVHGLHLQHRYEKIDTRAYKVEFSGDEGRIIWRTNEAWFYSEPHYLPEIGVWEKLDLIMPPGFDACNKVDEADLSYVDDFVCALDIGDAHECSGEEGVHVLEVLLGIFDSCVTGQSVTLPQQNRIHPLSRWLDQSNAPYPTLTARGYQEWLRAEDKRLGRNY